MPEIPFDRFFEELPIIVTLHGIEPAECAAMGEGMVAAGIRLLEVPLNVADPLGCIRALADAVGERALVGAASVYRAEDVNAVKDAGGSLISAPNTNPDVVHRAVEAGLVALPGCFTATEAVVALVAGAHALRFFPGDLITIDAASAFAEVLPPGTRLLLDGGVSADNIAYWRDTPIHGFVIGNAVYEPGVSAEDAALRAADLVATYRH